MQNSWKTSFAGIAALLIGLGTLGGLLTSFLAGDAVSMTQVGAALTAIAAGFMGIYARDNSVTSEEAGAK